MIKEEIKIYQNATDLSQGFTEFIQNLLTVYPYINLSLSGGTTPQVIFDYWAENCKESIDWSRITFYWGDERCVPPEHPMSNFGVAKAKLFDKVPNIEYYSIKRIHGENEVEEEAEWYSRVLERRVMQRNNMPSFEITMLGLGDDGHTVSIFPNQIDLWNKDESVLIAEHPDTGMKRLTISGKVVNNSQYAVFLVMGKNKAEKVRDIIKNRKELKDKYPAAKVDPKYGYLYWFLDEEAASLL